MKVSQLSFSYSKKKIFHDLNLEVPTGHLLGITGPNGSGKTTLLQVLAGLLKPTTGHYTSLTTSLFLPDTGFYEDLTLRENLEFYLKLYASRSLRVTNGSAAIPRVDLGDCHAFQARNDTISPWRLDAFLDQPVKHLSRGQRMRGSLCRTFLKEADLYLLDEPALGLDSPSLQALQETLISLKQTGKRVIVAGPDLNAFETVLDSKFTLGVA